MDNFECRLCSGLLTSQFKLLVLQKYEVQYSLCTDCQSLQTELPYWLDEAYKNNNLSNLDTGAAQRNINNLAACYWISKLFNIQNVIDIGGGDGLLCRLLRDFEINCFVTDKYATSTYAQGYTQPNFETPDLVIGFEMLEHLPNPSTDLDILFKTQPKTLLLSTLIYNGQPQHWWYLSPEAGQHVFFYSQQALNLIAKKYGYTVITICEFILFTRDISSVKLFFAKILLKPRVIKWMKALLLTRPVPGVWKDHLSQVEKSKLTCSSSD
jgi:hypothetical protein